MKKFLLSLIIFLAIVSSVLVISVGAAEIDFVVTVAGNNVITAGNTYDYTIKVSSIKPNDGIISCDIELEYDSDVFEFSKISASKIDGWAMLSNTKIAGKITICPATDDQAAAEGDSAYAVKKDNVISYTVSLKAKTTSKHSTTITVKSASAVDVNYNSCIGSGNSVNISVKQTLPAPAGLSFTDGVAKWNAVENADSYSVQIYKDGREYGEPISTTKTEYNFSERLTDGGKYCFTVTAISDKPEYGDSTESSKSADYTVVGKLTTPKITISSDLENGGLKYQITDTNSDGTVHQYIVDIYIKGSNTVIKNLESNSKAGNIPCDGTDIIAGKEYTVTVTAITKDAAVNKDSETSPHSASAKAAAKVKNIQIKTQPKLVYVDGEKLDLSAMIVTVNYDNGTSEDVAFKDFGNYNLTASMENGKKLSMSDSGKTLTVSFGDKSSATTSAITVNSNECKHTKTHTEQKTPSCGEDGYDRVICDDCGITVSETILPATGAHQFGDWEIIVKPTEVLKGVKERTCNVCGHKETEEIPATGNQGGSDSSNDTEPSTTDDDTTSSDPGAETTGVISDNGGGMSDLSRIFLIIVIVVFSIILLFIVGAVWLENRRNKARRARMNQRNSNAGRRR